MRSFFYIFICFTDFSFFTNKMKNKASSESPVSLQLVRSTPSTICLRAMKVIIFVVLTLLDYTFCCCFFYFALVPFFVKQLCGVEDKMGIILVFLYRYIAVADAGLSMRGSSLWDYQISYISISPKSGPQHLNCAACYLASSLAGTGVRLV